MSNQKSIWELYKEGTLKEGSIVKLKSGETVTVGEISDVEDTHQYFFFSAQDGSEAVHESFSIESLLFSQKPIQMSSNADISDRLAKRKALAEKVLGSIGKSNPVEEPPLHDSSKDVEVIIPSPLKIQQSGQAGKEKRKLAIPQIVLEQLNIHVHQMDETPVPEVVAVANTLNNTTKGTLINDVSSAIIKLSNILAKALENGNPN